MCFALRSNNFWGTWHKFGKGRVLRRHVRDGSSHRGREKRGWAWRRQRTPEPHLSRALFPLKWLPQNHFTRQKKKTKAWKVNSPTPNPQSQSNRLDVQKNLSGLNLFAKNSCVFFTCVKKKKKKKLFHQARRLISLNKWFPFHQLQMYFLQRYFASSFSNQLSLRVWSAFIWGVHTWGNNL